MQNASSEEISTTVNPYKVGAFEEYISYCAIGGLITSDDGRVSKMTITEFCAQFGVDRKTTWRWKQMPGFGQRVRERREELFPMARETACWNQLYLITLQSKDLRAAVQAATILLGHFSNLQLPNRRQEQQATGTSLAEILSRADKIMAMEASQ